MAAKELKVHLKKAKAAIDKQDYQEVKACCQSVLRLDGKNYTGLVFSGLAALKLLEYDEAKHYYKAAVACQPDGPLAWKGFADYYDKHKPVIQEEQTDAIEVYSKLLQFIESDVVKSRAALSKLVSLYKELDLEEEAVQCYNRLVSTYEESPPETETGRVSQICSEFVVYVIARENLAKKHWDKVQRRFGCIQESGEKPLLRAKVVKKAYARYMAGTEYDESLHEFVVAECGKLLGDDCHASLPILLHLTLMQLLPASVQDLVKVELSDSQRSCISTVSLLMGQAVTDVTPHLRSLGWAGLALVGVADRKWSDALDCISKSVSCSTVLSECWCMSSLLHLYHRDYQSADKSAANGLSSLSKCAKFMSTKLETSLKLCQCEAYIGSASTKQLNCLLPFLAELHQDGCGQQVTNILVRAHLLLGDIRSAEQVMEVYKSSECVSEVKLCGYLAQIAAAKKDFDEALKKVSEGLELEQDSPWLLFLKAKILWDYPGMKKATIYAALMKAAKVDSSSPDIFCYLGDYHRLVSKDHKRAEKCYLKTLSLQSSHWEAALGLGDILWNNEERDRAYQVYRDITSAVPLQRSTEVWLRVGMYQKDKGQYDEAIKSFQTVLSIFPDDKQCWDCLGEAYLARGSFNSALRTFTMCAQLNPESLHCKYRVAHVNQTLGLVQEAVEEYSAILDVDHLYFPALFGRGECYLNQARTSLQQNFDGRAVDYISKALADLSLAARLHPEFLCTWKLLGDCCVCLHPVNPTLCCLPVPSVLCGVKTEDSEDQAVGKADLLRIGCRCYEKALQMNQEAAHFWHDLAQAYYHLAKCFSVGSADEKNALETALKAAETAVDLKPTEFSYWNTMAVIAASPGVYLPALAQHCFIRSLQEQESALAWANLAALYLKHDKVELAYEAFKKAQAYSPDCVEAWIGHALIAERIGNSESMDLFRHATELQYHPEASVGYGYWVCQTLKTLPVHLLTEVGGVELQEEVHRGVARARDNLEKLQLRSCEDACVLNYLGLLCEQEGRAGLAEKLLERAARCTTKTSELEMIQANLARIQSSLGKVSGAISRMDALKSVGMNLNLELALAYFKSTNREKSCQAYEDYMLGVSQEAAADKSALLTAQAMGAFSNHDKDSCKSFLFEAAQAAPVSVHGLVALCALACTMKDSQLLEATLTELSGTLDWQEKESRHILHPSCRQTLRVISYLIENTNLMTTSVGCIDVVLKLLETIPEPNNDNLPPPTPLHLHAMFGGDCLSLSSAQKLVHSYPADIWALYNLTSGVSDDRIKAEYNKIVLEMAKSQLETQASSPKTPWKTSVFKALAQLYSILGGDLSFMV